MNRLRLIFLGDNTHRPAVTLPQLIAAIPLLANLLAAYGIFAPTAAQQGSLTDLLTWAYVLIVGDAALRIGRNVADGIKARAVQPAPPQPVTLSFVGNDIDLLAASIAAHLPRAA